MNKHRISNKKIKFTERYSSEEFVKILKIVPKSTLIQPIKKNRKEFTKEIHGFRVSRISENKLHAIYIKRVLNGSDPILEGLLSQAINEVLDDIDSEIVENIGNVDIIRKQIEADDMVCFEKLVDVLLSSHIKTNIILYFKLVNLKLSDKQEEYCNKDLPIRLEVQKKEIELGNLFQKELNDKLKKIEETYNKELSKRNEVICSMEKEMTKLVKKYELLNESKDCMCTNYINQLDSFEIKIKKIVAAANQSLTIEKGNNLSLENLLREKNKEIEQIQQLIEAKEEDFESVFYDKWKKNHKVISEELKDDEDAIVKLKHLKQSIKDEVFEFKKELSDLKVSRDYIENNTKELVDHIFSVFDLKHNSKNINDKLFVEISENHVTNSEAINDREDYIEDLKSNLEIAGINSKYSFIVSQYIYATIANNMGLLLLGPESRLIANAISLITCSRSIDVVSLPPGFTDSRQLLIDVSASKSRVVLIEGAVDNLYESVYLPLLKSNHDKIIMFSLDSRENIKLIPSAIYDYVMLLDNDSMITFSRNEPFLCAIASEECFVVTHDLRQSNKKINWLNNFDSILDRSNTTKMKISSIMSTIDNSNSNSNESECAILLLYFNLLMENTNKIDEYCDFINQIEIPKAVSSLFEKYKESVS